MSDLVKLISDRRRLLGTIGVSTFAVVAALGG